MYAKFVHCGRALRRGIAQVNHLSPAVIQNAKAWQRHCTVRTLLRVVIEEVIPGKHAESAASIDTDSTLVVSQHVVIGRGRKSGLTTDRGVRRRDVLKKRLGRSRPSRSG